MRLLVKVRVLTTRSTINKLKIILHIMAGQLNLSKYNASDVYTLEVDASITVTLTPTIGRLVIGSSKIGAMNTAVNLRNPGTRAQVYGNIDRSLENKGSYFHRCLDVTLNEGPVFGLNVVPLDLEQDDSLNQDLAYITTFNTESASESEDPVKTAIMKLFNKQKFWNPGSKELNRAKNNKYVGANANKILTFSNMSKKPVTVFVKKAETSGYDVTAEEWYTSQVQNAKMPNFVHPEDFISDYFVDVMVIEGDWSNYKRLSDDPVYYKFFEESGLIKNKIDEFLSVGNVKLITRVQGCIIPEFTDTNGVNVSVDRLFNNRYPVTEMYCAIDEDVLDEMDLQSGDFDNDLPETHRIDVIGHGYEDMPESKIDDYSNYLIDVLSYKKPVSNLFKYEEAEQTLGVPENASAVIVDETSEPNTIVKAYEESNLYKAWKLGYLNNEDLNVDESGSSPQQADVYINITENEEDISGTTFKLITIRGNTSPGIGSADIIYDEVGGVKVMTFDNGQSNYTKEVDLTLFDNVIITNNNITIETTNTSDDVVQDMLKIIKKGYYLLGETPDDERSRIIKILSVSKRTDGTEGSPGYVEKYHVQTMATKLGIKTFNSTKLVGYVGIPNFVDKLKGQFMDSFKLRKGVLPNGTKTRQKEIMQFVHDTNLIDAITEGLDVRHIVDTYDGEIDSSSKYEITSIAAKHGKAMAFVNDPSMEQFEKSTDPSFIKQSNGLLSMEFISQGGNLNLNPSFEFTLPQDTTEDGIPIESYAYFTMPYIIIRENNRNKSIPPAAYMSNLFLRKLNTGNQYGVAAGRKGVLTEREIVGLEYEFTNKDRGFLEPIGHNLLVRRRGIGIMAMTNNTAYQRVQSALNNAHVRDSLITIERRIEQILFNYLFDFNDEITRIRVRSQLEDYLDGVEGARGISSYDIQFDASNNTNEVISENAGIVDISVDFPRPIQKFINRITITKVGGELSATSTGFVPA